MSPVLGGSFFSGRFYSRDNPFVSDGWDIRKSSTSIFSYGRWSECVPWLGLPFLRQAIFSGIDRRFVSPGWSSHNFGRRLLGDGPLLSTGWGFRSCGGLQYFPPPLGIDEL